MSRELQLPLVDEIRQARSLQVISSQAVQDMHRVGTGLQALSVIEGQHALRPSLLAELPGDRLMEELAERWQALSDLPGIGPNPSQPFAAQLSARRAQLQLAQQVLQPHAAAAQARGQALSELQHRQRHLLDDPRYTEQVAQLTRLGHEREQLAQQLDPLHRRQAMITPALDLLNTFAIQLRQAHDHGKTEVDRVGVAAWRAASMAANLLQSMEGVLGLVQLTVPIPAPPVLPDQPSAEVASQLWDEVARVVQQLEELHAVLRQQGGALDAETAAAATRHDEVMRQIVELMG